MSLKSLNQKTKEVRINGKQVQGIRFADDIVIVAENEHDLNIMLTNLSETLEEVQLKINAKKTKVLLMDGDSKAMERYISQYRTAIEEVK